VSSRCRPVRTVRAEPRSTLIALNPTFQQITVALCAICVPPLPWRCHYGTKSRADRRAWTAHVAGACIQRPRSRNQEAKVPEPDDPRRTAGRPGSFQQNARRARPRPELGLVETNTESVFGSLDYQASTVSGFTIISTWSHRAKRASSRPESPIRLRQLEPLRRRSPEDSELLRKARFCRPSSTEVSNHAATAANSAATLRTMIRNNVRRGVKSNHRNASGVLYRDSWFATGGGRVEAWSGGLRRGSLGARPLKDNF